MYASALLSLILAHSDALYADDHVASATTEGEQFSANFKETDIKEFINTVAKNLERTVVFDPSVRGKITVRSYEMVDDESYYHMFESVLEVYGYAVVEQPSGLLKIIKSKKAKSAAIRLAHDGEPGTGDEMVTRIVPVYNVNVRQLAPILRQLSDNAGGGNVSPYEPSNVLMITGRAAAVERLVNIVKRVDLQGDIAIQVVKLKYASASELVRIIESLNRNKRSSRTSSKQVKVVADERTNSIIVTAGGKERARTIRLIHRLDGELETQGNTQVRYMKYGKAEEIADVLAGYAKALTDKSSKGKSTKSKSSGKSDVKITFHKATNSLVMTAEPSEMAQLNSVIDKLDIPRMQVHIEAIIVEVEESDGFAFGIDAVADPASNQFGLVQHKTDNTPQISQIGAGVWGERGDDAAGALAGAAKDLNVTMLALKYKDWAFLLKAHSLKSNSNVLSTPHITTLDNQEAVFSVGQSVSVQSQTSGSGSSADVFKTNYEQKDAATTLKVTPQVNAGGSMVNLTIEQTSDELGTVDGNGQPTFTKRKLTSSIDARTGEIIVVGGLIKEKTIETQSKVPFLGDIPILGELFKSTSTSNKKTNLIIFIKPTIIQDSETMYALSGRKYNYMRAMQLHNNDEGVESLLAPSYTTTLKPWQSQALHSEEVQKILDKYPQRFPLENTPASQYIKPSMPQPEVVPEAEQEMSEEEVMYEPAPLSVPQEVIEPRQEMKPEEMKPEEMEVEPPVSDEEVIEAAASSSGAKSGAVKTKPESIKVTPAITQPEAAPALSQSEVKPEPKRESATVEAKPEVNTVEAEITKPEAASALSQSEVKPEPKLESATVEAKPEVNTVEAEFTKPEAAPALSQSEVKPEPELDSAMVETQPEVKPALSQSDMTQEVQLQPVVETETPAVPSQPETTMPLFDSEGNIQTQPSEARF